MEKREKRKLNLIDLLVFLAAVAVVVLVVLNMTGILGGDSAAKESVNPASLRRVRVDFTVKVEDVDRDLYLTIKEYIDQAKREGKLGDQMMAAAEMMEDGFITDVTAVDRETVYRLYGGDSYITLFPERKNRVDMTFTCVGYSKDSVNTVVGDSQEVRVGRSYAVKSAHFEITGSIISCAWTENAKPAASAVPSASGNGTSGT